MAFIGSDGLDRQLKQLKTHLASKDSELTSIRNEQRKRTDELNEAKKAREAVQYQLQEEEQRAQKIQTALQAKTQELSKLRLQHDNLETTLRTSSEKVKNGEKENQKLQYEMDRMASGDMDGASRLLQEQKTSLEMKVRALESALRKAEVEKRIMEDNLRAAGKIRSVPSTTSSFGGAPSPARPKGSRRRSASFSGGARTSDLDAEVENLKVALDASSAELTTIKVQLSNAKKEKMKLENEKIAGERSAKKEIEQLSSKLEDASYELEEWRSGGDGNEKQEAEKLKKAAEVGMDRLREKWEQEVEKKCKTIEELERKVVKLEELEVALQEERKAKPAPPLAAVGPELDPASSTQLEALSSKIANLEANLAAARSEAPATLSEPADRATRKLQRELESARRDNKALEEQVDELHERAHVMASRVPLPESPSSSPRPLASADSERLAILEDQVVSLEGELEQLEFRSKQEILGLETQLNEASKELEAARMEIRNVKTAFEVHRGEMEAFSAQRKSFESDLKVAQAAVSVKQSQVNELESDIANLHTQLSDGQTVLSSVKEMLARAQQRLQEAVNDVAEKDRQLVETIAQNLQAMSQVLEQRKHEDAEVEELRNNLVAKQQSIDSIQSRVTDAEAARQHKEVLEFGARQELDIAREEVKRLKEEVSGLQTMAANAEKNAQAVSAEMQEAMNSLKQQLDDTAGETHTLRLTLEDAQTALTTASSFADSLQNQYEEVSADKLRLEDELARQQETIANRSTESESRQRDEQLFRYKEDREVLQWTLEVDRQQHEKDIAAVTFGKAQDIRAARARMSELESRVSELQAVLRDAQKSRGEGGNEHVGQLELKVQLLRAERDDSRRSQSFGEHEHHFALKTAEADRASAVEDLAHARCELQEHLTAHDNLQKETGKLRERLQDVSARLESVAGSFATASTEKNDLADRVAHLELEVGHATTVRDELERKVVEATQQEATSLEAHRTHHEQLVDLASRLVMEQSERSKAQNELVMSNRARSDLESRVDQLHVRIIELQEAQPLREDDSPSNGHVRSRSSTSSSTALQSLQAEKADLQSRLQRRILIINQVQAELKRVNMNLHMAQESLKEYEDEIDELKAERDAIKADLDRQGTSLQDSQRMLNDATAQIRDHSVRIVDFRTNTQAAETESMSRVRNLVLMIAFHRKALTYRTAGWRNATRPLQEATTTISNLRSDISTLEVVRSEVNNLSLRVEEVETARSAVQTDLQRSREDLKKALSEAQTLRTALDETRVSLSSAQQAGVEHSSALARVAELEREISASGERTRGLESDIENLLAKLASAEKARSEAVGTAEAETISLITRLSELESTEGRAASLQSELDTLLADLAARDQTHAEAMTGAKLQMAELFESRKMYERRTAGLRDQLAIKTAEVEAYNAQIHQKTIEVAGLESQLAESSRDIEVGRKTISDHREQLEQLEALSSGTLAEREALRERIVDLQTKVSVLLAERTVLRRDFAETADQHLEIVTGLSTASMEVETLRTANLEHQSSLRGLQANVEKLEEEVKHSANMVKFKDVETNKLSASLKSLQDQLVDAKQEQTTASNIAKAKQIEVSRLLAENAKLKESLAKTSATLPAGTEASDLQERITELEASLTLKVQELDESDDRVRDLYKNNSKLEKKVAKLSRQLATAETAANTAANKSIAGPAVPMGPPPIPLAKPAPPPSPASTLRQPLRQGQVNVFEPTPSIGSKRGREGEVDENPMPAECIVLPPSAEKAKKHVVRTAFTPQRGGVHAFASRENNNIFANPERSNSVTKPMIKNAFARNPTSKMPPS